jgi:phospholipase C
MSRMSRRVFATAALAAILAACGGTAAPASSPAPATPVPAAGPVTLVPGKTPIQHVVVIYLENRSFDSLYGNFPGAEGLAEAGERAVQTGPDGKPYQNLPPIMNTNYSPPIPDSRFPFDSMPNKPFDIDQYVAADKQTGDLVHRYYQEQLQIDGGKMDKFAQISDAQGLVMGYYDGSKLPVFKLAQQYTLADHFFHAAFGGSFLNHFWLVCACTPVFPNAPAGVVAKPGPDGLLPLDDRGKPANDGFVTPDGFAINTAYSANTPHPASAPAANLVPPQTMPHIGDRLDDARVSWAWYSGGWNDALAGRADPLFQFHHQAFAYFKDLGDGTPGRAQHLKDEVDFMAALKSANTLPQVSFIKPLGPDNEHPGYANLVRGEQHTADLVKAIQDSPYWKDSAIIITYDEHGGAWDHVAPPKGDRWGPGLRVPTIIISPYARKGFVDKTVYDTTAILKFIENNWGLQALGTRDAAQKGLDNAFDFTQKPA